MFRALTIKRLVFGLLAWSLVATLLMGACAKPAPPPAPSPAPVVKPSPAPGIAPAPAPSPTPALSPAPVIRWNLSLWGGPRSWTRHVERWAEDMSKQTNGRWQIKVHYGEVLAAQADNPDGIKGGLFEAGGYMGLFSPGKLPLSTVLGLPFLSPSDPVQVGRLSEALGEHPAITEELGKWNARLLLMSFIEPYELMGSKRIATTADLKGARIRIAADAGKPLEKFGAVSVMVPTPDIYTGLERGTFDLVAPAPVSAYDYKWYEVSKYYTTGLGIQTNFSFYMCSKKAWDALPEEFKKLHMAWQPKSVDELLKDRIPLYKESAEAFKKAKLEFIEFPPAERAKLVEASQPFWGEWVSRMEARGLPGKALLDYIVAKRKAIAGY